MSASFAPFVAHRGGMNFRWRRLLGSGFERLRHRHWPHLGLAQRIMVRVGLGVAAIVVVIGWIVLATTQQIADATGREQVTVAETVALQVAARTAGQSDSVAESALSGRDDQSLLPAVPDGLTVELVTTGGEILASNGSSSLGRGTADLSVTGSLIDSHRPGYRIHYPAPGENFPPHVVAFAPVPDNPALGIFVQQAQPATVSAPDDMIKRLLIFGGLALLVALLFAWLDVSAVLRPVTALAAAAESFAAGELGRPIAVRRSDEIASLASTFEIMRQQLSQSMAEIERWNRELEQRVEQRTADVERRNRQLAAINAVAQPLSGSLETADVIRMAMDSVRSACGFDMVACRLTSPKQSLPIAASRDLPPALACEDDIEPGSCLCGRAVLTGRCQHAVAIASEPDAEPCRAAGVASAVVVPFSGMGHVQGVLFFGSHSERQLESFDLDTLCAIGRQVGMALANAALYERLGEREREKTELLKRVIDGQEADRRRLAQELHDDASQSLTWLQLGLERLAGGREPDEQARALARELQRVAGDTLTGIHRMARELRPSVLDDVGLTAAVERYVREMAERYELQIDFVPVGVGGLRLNPEAEIAAYRIIQAALTNAVEHAQPRRASVLLQRRAGKLVVAIEDDGPGFDVAAVRARPLELRLGLAGMEERADLIGADLTVESNPGGGTGVFLEVPIESNRRRGES